MFKQVYKAKFGFGLWTTQYFLLLLFIFKQKASFETHYKYEHENKKFAFLIISEATFARMTKAQLRSMLEYANSDTPLHLIYSKYPNF